MEASFLEASRSMLVRRQQMVLLAANMHEKAVSCSFNNNGL